MLFLVGGGESHYVADYELWERGQAAADAARVNAFLKSGAEPRLVLDKQDAVMYWIAWIVFAGVATLLGWLITVAVRSRRSY